MRRRLSAAAIVGLPWLSVGAQSTGPPQGHLGLATQPVALPAASHVVVVFILVAALAIGLAVALRRVSPGLFRRLRPNSAADVTILARQGLEPGVSLHIVSVAGERLAIVTSRSGVAVHGLSVDSRGAPGSTSTGTRP